LIALKPFPFRGKVLSVDEEFEPDNEAQAAILVLAALAAHKTRAYRTRVARVEHTTVSVAEGTSDA